MTGKGHTNGATGEQYGGLGEKTVGWPCLCVQSDDVYFYLSKEIGFDSDSRNDWCQNFVQDSFFFPFLEC